MSMNNNSPEHSTIMKTINGDIAAIEHIVTLYKKCLIHCTQSLQLYKTRQYDFDIDDEMLHIVENRSREAIPKFHGEDVLRE